MKRINANILLAAAVSSILFASCDKARISGTIADAPDCDVVVNLLDVNKLQPLDTVRTDSQGHFSCKVSVTKGNPEFFYINRAGVRLASVLVDAGDHVRFTADTVGNFELSGSEMAKLHSDAERDYRDFTARMDGMSQRLLDAPDSLTGISREMTQAYVQYYRRCVRFVMENSHSMAVIPVFYQKAGSLPVFAQDTDAIHFKNVCDSLETVYPDSRYVKALRAEADRRMNTLSLATKIQAASSINFPDINLPDINSQKKRLSEVEAKVVMVHFWTNSVPEQRRFNLEVLKPIYQMYSSKGLEIYQVALDPDKAGWAATIREQKLPWISVCDIAGAGSRNAALYNVNQVPTTFLIANGELVGTQVTDIPGLLALLESLLK